MTQREPGEPPREQNEVQEGPKVRGNETQEGPKGPPKGSRRVTNGARRASIVPRRIPKGSKRRPRGPKRGQDATGGFRRVAKGSRIGEFDDCYTVS